MSSAVIDMTSRWEYELEQQGEGYTLTIASLQRLASELAETDGCVETESETDEMFGADRLEELVPAELDCRRDGGARIGLVHGARAAIVVGEAGGVAEQILDRHLAPGRDSLGRVGRFGDLHPGHLRQELRDGIAEQEAAFPGDEDMERSGGGEGTHGRRRGMRRGQTSAAMLAR